MLRRYVQRFLVVNPVQDILLTCCNFDSLIYGRALSLTLAKILGLPTPRDAEYWIIFNNLARAFEH